MCCRQATGCLELRRGEEYLFRCSMLCYLLDPTMTIGRPAPQTLQREYARLGLSICVQR